MYRYMCDVCWVTDPHTSGERVIGLSCACSSVYDGIVATTAPHHHHHHHHHRHAQQSVQGEAYVRT